MSAKIGTRPAFRDGRDAGEEGDGGDDDLGAAVQAEGLEGELECAGAAVDADAVAGVVGRGEGLFELDDGIAVGAVAGAETVGEGGDVLLGEDGPGRERLGADGGAAGEREGWHVRTGLSGVTVDLDKSVHGPAGWAWAAEAWG